MKKRVGSWLERVSSRTLICIGIMVLMLALVTSYINFQGNIRQAIHDLHARALAGESISCNQTCRIGKYYKLAVAGLSDADRSTIDAEIHEIASVYTAQQVAIATQNRAFGRNDDPGPGPHIDDNGWMADIPSAWTPPVDTGVNVYVNLKTLDAFNPPQAWDACIAPPN